MTRFALFALLSDEELEQEYWIIVTISRIPGNTDSEANMVEILGIDDVTISDISDYHDVVGIIQVYG